MKYLDRFDNIPQEQAKILQESLIDPSLNNRDVKHTKVGTVDFTLRESR